MMRNGRSCLFRPGFAIVLLAVAVLGPGCQNWTPLTPPPPAPPAPPRPVESMDACSERLDDLCGRLMLYYAAHRGLPAQLQDLGTPANPLPADALVCPINGNPYIYDPAGVRVMGLVGRLIVYDDNPCHSYDVRAGILAVQLQPGRPAVCKVVRPRDKSIIWMESPPAGPTPPPPPQP